MGIRPEDDAHIHRLSQELFGSKDSDVARSDNDETIASVVQEFGQYFMGLAMQRRAAPTDDLGSVLANATIGGNLLAPEELVPYYVMMVTAGHDTVSTVLAGGIEALAAHPDQLARLQADPSLIPNAIEEMARWVTPTKHFMRTAVRDVELGDKKIAAGDWLLLSFPSANRDEDVFASPFDFDVTRSNASSHLAYGAGGPHFCLGAYLARLELGTFFQRFIPRVRSLEIDGDVVRAKTTFVATFKRLPVRMELADRAGEALRTNPGPPGRSLGVSRMPEAVTPPESRRRTGASGGGLSRSNSVASVLGSTARVAVARRPSPTLSVAAHASGAPPA
jgi:cytochrome P450